MDCARCGRQNRAGARFCGGCGGPLAPRCPACGSECEQGAGFCDACGAAVTPVAPAAEAAEARKVVTIVFADLIGSTALHERLDAESSRAFMDRYYQAMRDAVEAQAGRVTQLLGDGVKAVFGAPRVAEDDAVRAVRAAAGMQRAFRALADAHSEVVGEVGLRVAVNTGEVVADDETEIIGDPVNVAARLQQEARDGDVLVGEWTQRLVGQLVTLEPFGTFTLKGRAGSVTAWRVVSLERPAGAPAIAFVGRDEELRRITAVYDAAVAEPRARLAVILGSPGLGKSRLLAEIGHRLGDRAAVLYARCDAAGGATFAPIAEALRALLRVEAGASAAGVRAAIDAALPADPAERARVADGVAALLAGTPASPEETFFVVRRLLSALAAKQPVVLAIDDLQWAEPLLLDLCEHLVQWSSGVPLLLLAAARPELRDRRSSLATPGGLVADVLTLSGLDAGAATRLAANVIGADALPAAIAGRVLATSEGNPLFVGELVRMLVQDGALRREGDRWTAGVELADLEMPPTIHALLAARIERLRPEERSVLERAAVVGRHFSRAAVAELLPREQHADLDARLESLRRSELIEPDTGWLLGEPVLRFHHVLIRDAAYRRLLKGTRAELHVRFADWLERRAPDTAPHDETLGWHLEQAHQHLRELGPLDARGRALGERAARHLAAAGQRALARDDLSLAASLLGRALARLEADDPARADLTLDWCEALLEAGAVGPAATAVAELGRFAGSSDRLRAWHICFAGQLAVLTDPQALRATADAVAAAADELAAAADAAGEAKAHSVHALALARLGKIGACEAALDRALAAARRVRDRRRQNAVLASAPLAALWGPSPVTRASGRCLDVVRVLRITQGAPAVEAVALCCQGVLEALRGRGDAARRMIASSRHLVEELGITQRLLEADVFAGLVELIEGDAGAAERCLRAAYDGLRGHGLGIDAAQAAALLGRALLAQGRVAEAEAASHQSEALAGDDLKAAIAWRGVRAEALARRGEHAAAVDFARAAVELAAATDALLDHADARVALAAALHAAGRSSEALAEEARAIELWEAKGATLLAERARRGVGRTERATRAPDAPVRSQRRVRANAGTANAARLDAMIAARDADALTTLLADDAETVHHPSGRTYDRRGTLAAWSPLLGAQGSTFRNEPLATLGDSLALLRSRVSFDKLGHEDVDAGAMERVEIALTEVDARGLRRRAEFFAADRLGDAIARLYERYAELTPEGAERERAVASARTLAPMLRASGDLDPERAAASFAEDFEGIDHRSAGFGSGRGARAYLHVLSGVFELADDVAESCDDVLALRPDALLLRRTLSGRSRASGGAFESPTISLALLNAEGRFARLEVFAVEQQREALERFDALTGGSEPARPERRVHANAATAYVARLDAAITAGDADALSALFADDMQVVHHATGMEYGREGPLSRFRALFEAEDLRLVHEPLATLGDSLALCHAVNSVSALADDDVAPAGAVDIDTNVLIEVDAHGRQQRVEIFPDKRLGNAVARLYERHAERLPEGRERTRAAAQARAIATLLGPLDPDRYAAAIAPDLEFVDTRNVGVGPMRGGDELLRGLRVVLEVAGDTENRLDDILALRPDALLGRATTLGTDPAGGGAYERELLVLWHFGADGLLARLEFFEPDREEGALGRFDALAPGRPRPARRVRGNAAIAYVARLDAAIAARNADALSALFAPDVHVVHHATGAEFGRAGALSRFMALLAAEDLRLVHEPLATLGDSLALCHAVTSVSALAEADVAPAGAIDTDTNVLVEVDARGQQRRVEILPDARLGDAVARLYGRHAELLPDGPERVRAAEIARTVAILLAAPGIDRWATAFAPGIEWVDHRTVGLGSVHGAEAVVRGIGALFQLMEFTTTRTDDIFALRDDAIALRWTNLGTDRAGGGPVERSLCHVWSFGADGLLARWESFEAEGAVEALDRYDELVAEPPAARFANAASRFVDRSWQSWHERDWEAVRACFAPSCELDDRRSLVHLRLSGEDFLANQRLLFETTSLRWAGALLATRGDRLALFRMRFEGEALDSGSLVLDHLCIAEVDASGRAVTLVLFDPSDLDAAGAELDDRYAAGEAAPFASVSAGMRAFDRAFASRDWDALAARCAPDLVVNDHRLLGWETLRGPEAYVQALRSLVELAPDTRLRLDHVTLSRHGYLVISVWVGSREGGAFEAPSLMVAELDGQARIRRFDQYDLERRGEAQARFDELSAATAPPRVENAATRAQAVFERCWRERDWEGVAAHFGPGFRMEDRRALVGISLSGADFVANLRLLSETDSSRFHTELLATRGERLALFRTRFSGEIGGGLFEDLHLSLVERDDSGRGTALVIFDLADLDAAYAELDAHYASGEAVSQQRAALTSAFIRAFATRDWDALAALLAPDLVVEDHRLLGWETLHGPAAYIQALGSLVELAPDVRLRVDHVTMSGAGFLYLTTWQGTREGGAFETPSVIVCELDAQARIRRFDQYDLDQQGEARARLDSIGAGAARDPLAAFRPDPLRIPPNAASRAGDRFQACGDAGDWDGLRALFAPTLVWDDRRHLLRNTSDREMAVANARLIREAGARAQRKRLATCGDRLVLEHVRVARDEGAVWEVEALQIIEVDGEGRIVAIIAFDPDDRRAASAEMREHFFLGEGAGLTPPGAIEAQRAWHDNDLARLRAALPDDFWFHDHRRTGAGRIDGANAYVRSVAALFEQARVLIADPLYHIALEPHGALAVARTFGTLLDGGAVESVFVRLSIYRDDQFVGLELFELDDLAAARARFEALRPADPLRIPPNAATRIADRWQECAEAGDWDGLRALIAPIVFEDRRRLSRTSGDCELVVHNNRLIFSELGARPSRTLLATLGDRICLERVLWTGGPEGGAFEVDTLQVFEVDAERRVVALIAFDPTDRRAASLEMFERHARSDAADSIPTAAFEAFRALNAHDLDRLRAVLPEGFVFHDHRRTGLGRVEGASFIASLAPLFEQAPDLTFEGLYTLVTEKHGELVMARVFGTLANSGGEVESVYLRLGHWRGDRIVGMELFEPEDLAPARARLEALRPDPARIPPNAALRGSDRVHGARDALDWDAFEAACAPVLDFDDRRRSVLTSGDRDMFIANSRWIAAQGIRADRTLLAIAGDRLALEHGHWTGANADVAASEADTLSVTEVDADGRIVAAIVFDPDDRRAAFAETEARFAAGEGAGSEGIALIGAFMRAYMEQDWGTAARCLADDFVLRDYRKLGLGVLGRDEWLALLRAMDDLTRDWGAETTRILAWSRYGRVDVTRQFGTLREGGPFDAVFIRVLGTDGARIRCNETFDLADADRALARFAELGADRP